MALFLLMSGLGAVSTVRAGDPTRIEDQVQSALRSARHVRADGGRPSLDSSQLDSLEQGVLDWRSAIERALGGRAPDEKKLELINRYFNVVAGLTSLRIALTLPHGPGWLGRFDLRIARAELERLPTLGAPVQDRLGQRYFALVIEGGADGRADPARLRISESLVQGLELGALSDQPNESNHLTLIQYLATRQLLQNLSDLRALKADHRVAQVRIPTELTQKISTLGITAEIQAEQGQSLNEPALREALARAAARGSEHLARFSSEQLTSGIASILMEDPYRDPDDAPGLRDLLSKALLEAESTQGSSSLADAIEASRLPLGLLSDAEVARSLRQWVAGVRAECVLNTLIQLMGDGALELSADERSRIAELIDRRKAAYATSLSERTLTGWIAKARSEVQQTYFAEKREQFIRDLVQSSIELERKLKESSGDLKVDPGTLARSLSGFMAGLQLREPARDWVLRISGAESWAAARDLYSGIMAEQIGPEALVNGIVSPERVREFLRTHDFSPEISFSRKINPELARKLKERITQGRRKDLSDLLAIGEKMGFHHEQGPILGWRDRRRYRSMLKVELLSRYPILDLKVGLPLDHPILRGKLYQALTALAPDGQVDGSVIVRATPLIDYALSRIEAQLVRNIQTVGQAKDLHAIERVITGSVMLQLVMNGFPEFQLEQERFAHDLLEPSLASQLLRRYAGSYLGWGFGGLMLLEGTKFIFRRSAPFVDAITSGLDPWIQGYLHTAVVAMLAQTADELHELKRARAAKQQSDAFFHAAAEGTPLIDFIEQSSADSSYRLSKWSFLGRVSMDAAFMYYPMLKPVLIARARELSGDLQAFGALGLRPGSWQELDRAIARAHSGQLAHGATLTDAERAYQRLSSKARTGQTWQASQNRPALMELELELRQGSHRGAA